MYPDFKSETSNNIKASCLNCFMQLFKAFFVFLGFIRVNDRRRVLGAVNPLHLFRVLNEYIYNI